MAPSFGALLCLKVLWTWGDEEKWTPFEGFDYWGRKCSCILALLFFSPLCFPPGANLWGCSILQPEWRWSKHNRINTLGNNFFLQLRCKKTKGDINVRLWVHITEFMRMTWSCWNESHRFIELGDSLFFSRLLEVRAMKCCLISVAVKLSCCWFWCGTVLTSSHHSEEFWNHGLTPKLIKCGSTVSGFPLWRST